MTTLDLHATPQEVMRAVEELRAFGRAHGAGEKVLFGLALALEECAENIVHHAYRDKREEKFQVSFERNASGLVIELRDRGPAFDLSTAEARDLGSPEVTRQAGGWGIHLVRHYTDEIHYERKGGENVLRLSKRIQSAQT